MRATIFPATGLAGFSMTQSGRFKSNKNSGDLIDDMDHRCSKDCDEHPASGNATDDVKNPPNDSLKAEWLTAREAAEYLRVKPKTILLWARQGHIKGYVLSGTQRVTWRFLQSDLDATMQLPSGALSKGRMRASNQDGSVVLDKRINTWNFFWWDNGKRHSKKIGTISQYPTKPSAWRAAKHIRNVVEGEKPRNEGPTVKELIEQYRIEKMPKRRDTRRTYEVWLSNYIIPRWGNSLISEVHPRPVELWIKSLSLAPKSKVHIRGVLRILWDFGMWRGDVPIERNPMELVAVKCGTKRTRQPRSLTTEEFQRFTAHLKEPFRTIALVCVCFGLRISEALALKWGDVDWVNGKLCIERGIVCQVVDEVKTQDSLRALHADRDLLDILKIWERTSQFSASADWVFASPVQLGRLPWSYNQVWRAYQTAAANAGIGGLGTHSLRHTYRSWLNAVGTSIAVQQKLMRHADVRTTMNIYGDIGPDEMAVASKKITQLALPCISTMARGNRT
jgi:integrase